MSSSILLFGNPTGHTLTCKVHNQVSGLVVTTISSVETSPGVYSFTIPVGLAAGTYVTVIEDEGGFSISGDTIFWDGVDVQDGNKSIAKAVRAELAPELAQIGQITGLTPQQATMLLELYQIMGLDPAKPLIVTQVQRTAGAGIHQNITGDQAGNTTIVRVV